jgi:type II secretory pathway pseudopilin PulG
MRCSRLVPLSLTQPCGAHSRHGFTLIELFVVFSIIIILASIALGALTILKRQQKVASTLSLMDNIKGAVDQYLADAPRLGNPTSSDFLNDPWEFFYKAQRRLGQVPLLELPPKQVVRKTGAGAMVPADALQTATHIVDHFGNTPANVLSFTIVNHSKGSGDNFVYANCILLRSSAGTLSDNNDDLVWAYSREKANWRKIKVADFTEFASELDQSPTPTLSADWEDPLQDY